MRRHVVAAAVPRRGRPDAAAAGPALPDAVGRGAHGQEVQGPVEEARAGLGREAVHGAAGLQRFERQVLRVHARRRLPQALHGDGRLELARAPGAVAADDAHESREPAAARGREPRAAPDLRAAADEFRSRRRRDGAARRRARERLPRGRHAAALRGVAVAAREPRVAQARGAPARVLRRGAAHALGGPALRAAAHGRRRAPDRRAAPGRAEPRRLRGLRRERHAPRFAEDGGGGGDAPGRAPAVLLRLRRRRAHLAQGGAEDEGAVVRRARLRSPTKRRGAAPEAGRRRPGDGRRGH